MSLTKVIAGMADDSIFAANKNVIINGNFDIWQRGTSFISISNSDISADRFKWARSGTGVVDILQSTSVPDNTSNFSLQVDVTTADASIAAGDGYSIQYKIEGYDATRFGFGTSDAKSLTISFWVLSSKTGIHCIALKNSDNTRSFVSEYTINVADTWEFKTITITADTTGTWVTDNGTGVQVIFALAVGNTFQTTADAWAAGSFNSTSSQVNVMDSAANNFHLSRVQIEVGSVATEFERRSFQQELAMAQRYTFRQTHDNTSGGRYIAIIYGQTGTNVRAGIRFPVEMRRTPTFSVSAASDFNVNIGGANKVPSALTQTGGSKYTANIDITTTGITIAEAGHIQLQLANSWIQWDAEL